MENSENKKANGEKENTSARKNVDAKVMNVGKWTVQNVAKGGLLDLTYRKVRSDLT